jgi:anti-sigma-K factor RskA
VGRDLTPAELDELLAVYALDAVDEHERAQVEEWIARTPRARREVDELREAASMLTSTLGADDDVPTDLWSRIESHLAEAPPPLRLAPVFDLDDARRDESTRRPRSNRGAWLVGIAATLVAVLAIAFAVVEAQRNSDQDARLDQMALDMRGRVMEEVATTAAMEPGARTAHLVSDNGDVMANVVTTADGRGYLVVKKLPKLPEGQTYQLWALMPDGMTPTMVSVGVLGRSPTVSAFTTDTKVMGYGLTMEDAPGVMVTDQPMMFEGRLT